MIQTINNSQFHSAFHQMGRGEQFSYEALNLIYSFLEDVNPEMELDVIAICCEFSEMTMQEVADAYGIEIPEGEFIDEVVPAYLQEHTAYLGETTDSVVFVTF